MTEASYEQATGLFTIHTALPIRHIGYAGRGRGRNNPDAQDVRNVGPLPQGVYRVGPPHRHPRLGPMAFRLDPDPANVMFGRSHFYIHGDNRANDASQGCIILPPNVRELVARKNVRKLYVFGLLPCFDALEERGLDIQSTSDTGRGQDA